MTRRGKIALGKGHAAAQSFVFADLCGFTEFTRRHGDERAAGLAIGFHARARVLAGEEACTVVKSIGDAVMVHSRDCRSAYRVASRIAALSGVEGYPQIRVGFDVGPAVEHDGDWFGATVNAAARASEAALPGELRLTDRARTAIAASASGLVAALHLAGPDRLLLAEGSLA